MSNDTDIKEIEERPARPRRSALYVPASNQRAMEKAGTLASDAVVYDLEDSVAPERKDADREALRTFLKTQENIRKEVVVRINPLASRWGTEDLLAARGAAVGGILLPKVEEPEDVLSAASALEQTDAPAALRLWAMIETPRGIVNVRRIAETARANGSRLDCLVVGTNDIAKETGMSTASGRAYLIPWLMEILLAARSAGLDVLDGVYNDFRDTEGFMAECRQGRDMGFDGKTLIHPSQIEAANRTFGLEEQAIAEARRIVAAFEEPGNSDKGVIQIDGRMFERLHLEIARKRLAKARAIAERA